jgi:hypothetical protein
MPVYGCFRMMDAQPDRTWAADYIVAKSEEVIQFWNRIPGNGKSDVLVGVARLGKDQTICDIESTKLNKPIKRVVVR